MITCKNWYFYDILIIVQINSNFVAHWAISESISKAYEGQVKIAFLLLLIQANLKPCFNVSSALILMKLHSVRLLKLY